MIRDICFYFIFAELIIGIDSHRYALNHPQVSYCQGMSDLASPLLVTMGDEAQAYICFCALMRRLSPNFLLDGITMTQRFQHLTDGLLHYDPAFYNYLKSHQVCIFSLSKFPCTYNIFKSTGWQGINWTALSRKEPSHISRCQM